MIADYAVTTAVISDFDLDQLSGAAKIHWEALQTKLTRHNAYGQAHPIAERLQWIPIFGGWYRKQKRNYTLGMR